METIYPPSQFPCTDLFPLNDYFRSFSKSVLSEGEPLKTFPETQAAAIFEWLGVDLSKNEINEIEEVCSVENLKVKGSHQPENLADHQNEAYVTLEFPIEITEKAQKFEAIQVKEDMMKNLDYLLYRTLCGKEGGEEIGQNETQFVDLDPGSDFILNVRIYAPYVFKFEQKNLSNKLKLSHEIQVLGSNKLTELRDKIVCCADVGLCKEVDTPTVNVSIDEAKIRYPSNFLFINNVFYNDMRSENAIDYSEVIRKWATEKGIKNLKTSSMENVLIKNLKPRLGYPYVYQHQANCEHIIVFSDAHILWHNDSLWSKEYPKLFRLRRSHCQSCAVCGLTNARWVCAHSERLPHEYMFMCHECFVAYNFIDGKKIGNFRAYPLFDKGLK